MNHRRLIPLAFALTLLAAPLFAQRHVDVDVFATWVDPSSNDRFSDINGNNFSVDWQHADGAGAAINIFLGGHLSAEFGISSVKPSATLRSDNPSIPAFAGSLRMVPITGVLQLHFAPESVIDPYIGAGVAYVLFDELNSPSDVQNLQFSKIDFKDDAGFAANAGLTIRLARKVGLYIDGKYVPLKSSATAVYATGPGAGTKLKINPAMIAVGLSFQF